MSALTNRPGTGSLIFLLAALVASPGPWQGAAATGDRPADGPAARGMDYIVLGMGCFWGAEKRMSALPGVVDVASGYAGGDFADPTYRSVLRSERLPGVRNHAEVAKVTFDPARTSIGRVLAGFWENHNPTQGDRQGNDVGSNYRSAVYYRSETQRQAALSSRAAYQKALTEAGYGTITTEIAPLEAFYPAEEYHQDYLVKNPDGYCGLGGTGVNFPGEQTTAGEPTAHRPLDPGDLSREEQLIVFESEYCPFCALFKEQVLAEWTSPVSIVTTMAPQPPEGWRLEKALWATPTIVLFRDGREVSRYTGYRGDREGFRQWLAYHSLSRDPAR